MQVPKLKILIPNSNVFKFRRLKILFLLLKLYKTLCRNSFNYFLNPRNKKRENYLKGNTVRNKDSIHIIHHNLTSFTGDASTS